jgi:hypothetical protein
MIVAHTRPHEPCHQTREPIDFASRAERLAVLQLAHFERKRDKLLANLMDFYAEKPLMMFQALASRLLQHAQADPHWLPY